MRRRFASGGAVVMSTPNPRLLPRLLLAPAVSTLLLWMIVPLVMTIYFSLIRYNLMQPEVSGFAGLDNFEYFITEPSSR
jgi:sorbitol/mannitol transport system permease protein